MSPEVSSELEVAYNSLLWHLINDYFLFRGVITHFSAHVEVIYLNNVLKYYLIKIGECSNVSRAAAYLL